MTESDTRVRIDKWLWAARFYKTRSLAADAVDSGKVKLNGERVKPAKLLKPGDMLSIRNGQSSWEVTVLALSERRGSATVASTLYRESDDSRLQRERQSAMLKAERMSNPFPGGRPTKRARRQIIRFIRDRE
jgi:ribosome-associated heat shock protein Hsp15